MKKIKFVMVCLCFLLSSCFMNSKEREESNQRTEDGDSFEIILPLASYNYGECLETQKYECFSTLNSVRAISITNSFELWQELTLTFSIKPRCGETLNLNSKDAITLEVYDEDSDSWNPVSFQIQEAYEILFDAVEFNYVTICSVEDPTVDWFFGTVPTVQLSFPLPKNFNSDQLIARLTIVTNKVDSEKGKILSEELFATTLIEYHLPETNTAHNDNWEGINTTGLDLSGANQLFELYVPVEHNPVLYLYPIGDQSSFFTLVLTFNDEQDILFDERLGLEVYQLVEGSQTWEPVEPPANQALVAIEQLSISNPFDETICEECTFFNVPINDTYSGEWMPRMMNVNGNRYLVFVINVNAADLAPNIEALRFLVKSGETIAFTDVLLQSN